MTDPQNASKPNAREVAQNAANEAKAAADAAKADARAAEAAAKAAPRDAAKQAAHKEAKNAQSKAEKAAKEAEQKAKDTFPEPAEYTDEQKKQIKDKNDEWKKQVTDEDDLNEILAMARRHCKDAKFVVDGMIFPCRNGAPSVLDCVPKTGKGGTTNKETLDAIKEKSGSKIDWPKVSKEEGGQQQDAYVPWSISFKTKKAGDGIQDVYVPVIAMKDDHVMGNSKSGVTVASGFDLGQENEDGLKTMGLSKELIEKLKPYLGKQRAAACKLLREKPLRLSKEECEEIDKAKKTKDSNEVKGQYNKIREKYNETHKDKPMRAWDDLSEGEQTALASRKYQDGNINTNSANIAIAQKIGIGDSKGAAQAYRGREGYKDYSNRYEAEIGWLPVPAPATPASPTAPAPPPAPEPAKPE